MELLLYLLLAFLGSLLHILKLLAKLENLSEMFSLKIWLRKNLYKTLYGLLASLITVVLIWNSGNISWLYAVLIGYTGDSILKTKFPEFKDSESKIVSK